MKKQWTALDRRVFIALGVLLLLLAGVIGLSYQRGLALPVVPGEVGAWGPVEVRFEAAMEPASVEQRLTLEPALPGRFVWQGNQLLFYPESLLKPGQTYTLTLAPGSRSQDGRSIRQEMRAELRVRDPGVAYLSLNSLLVSGKLTWQSELFWAAGDGSQVKQLTQTGGQVLDFGVSREGDVLVYALKNDSGGSDLWQVERVSGKTTRLLECASALCQEPVYSPDGRWIAYSRQKAEDRDPAIWILERSTLQTEALYPDPEIRGNQPAWAPNSCCLASYDPHNRVIHLFDLEKAENMMIPSNLDVGGSWAPDSRSLLFLQAGQAEGRPYTRVYQVDRLTRTVQPVLGEDLNQIEYSLPQWAPDGTHVVVALRVISGSPTQQLWWVSLDGSERRSIAENQPYDHLAYSWDPSGTKLAYQRVKLNGSTVSAQVMVWNALSQAVQVVSENGIRPAWVP